jgi:hypothetical protein
MSHHHKHHHHHPHPEPTPTPNPTPTPDPTPTPTPVSKPNQTEWVKTNSYYRWLNDGQPNGQDLSYWMMAKIEYAQKFNPVAPVIE